VRLDITSAALRITVSPLVTRPVDMWCDAIFAARLDSQRSVSEWVVMCFEGAVSWESCKQPAAAASTMDAEYQAFGAASREALSFCGRSGLGDAGEIAR
jgi:hypothetical protein